MFFRYDSLRKDGLKEERVLLLEAWREVEIEGLKLSLPGSGKEYVEAVEAKFPRKVQARGSATNDTAYDLIFPDDEQAPGDVTYCIILFNLHNKSSIFCCFSWPETIGESFSMEERTSNAITS